LVQHLPALKSVRFGAHPKNHLLRGLVEKVLEGANTA